MAARKVELTKHITWLNKAIRGAEPHELSALLRERRITLQELDELAGTAKGSKIDELAKRRKSRRSKAAVASKPVARGKQRGG